MNPKIYIHRYSLESKYVLNSRSERGSFEGALIRVNDGFGCIHPWQELGDPSLQSLLDSLRLGDASKPLVRNALECARIDGEARHQGVHLLDGLSVPESHATLVKPHEQLEEAVSAGFKYIKIKAGRDLVAEVDLLNQAVKEYPDLRWRLDFNQSLTRQQFDAFLMDLSSDVLDRIDFFEDPCREKENLEDLNVPLAIDRNVESLSAPYAVAVVKPALDHVGTVCERASDMGMRIVFTSYMDHPLGQSFAAYVAGAARSKYGEFIDPKAGLMTHDLFEPNVFTEALGVGSPQWKSACGTGLGFDDLLEALDWEKLS